MKIFIILFLFILVFYRLGIRGVFRLIGNIFILKVVIPLVFFGVLAAVLINGIF